MRTSKPGVAQESVKSLFIEMFFNETLLASGTGFVVRAATGWALITNRHNVTGKDQNTGQPLDKKNGGLPNKITIHHHSMFGLGSISKGIEKLYDDEDAPLWIEHPDLGPMADFVALPLKDVNNKSIFSYDPFNCGSAIATRVTDVVSVIGFPFGIRSGGILPIWATGFIASEPEFDHDDLPIMLIDCRTRRGQSGSAVVAYRSGGMVLLESGENAMFAGPVSRLLGIYSGRVNSESDLGIVWKTRAIAELVRSMNVR